MQERAALAGQVGVEGSQLPGVVADDGIPETALFVDGADADRDPYACAYISSPIRGLDGLLTIWPAIRRAHPKASLHVYYGWHTTPSSVAGQLKPMIDRKMRELESAGVVWHDRVPQQQLERELPKYGVLLYPCTFPEGYMIAGVRATAAGMIPVYLGTAALPETQHPSGCVRVGPDPADNLTRFTDHAIRAIEQSRAGTVNRAALRDWAAGHTWKKSADKILASWREAGLLGGRP